MQLTSIIILLKTLTWEVLARNLRKMVIYRQYNQNIILKAELRKIAHHGKLI